MATQWAYAGASSGHSQNAKTSMGSTQWKMVFPRRVYKAILSTLQPIDGTQSNTQRYDEWGNPITGTIEVFDIVNAGPRHRFTYNGLVVSNCRVLAYVANQTDVLGVFASGGDVYSFAASRIYGVPYEDITKGRKSSDPETAHKYDMMRQYGKTATLACIAEDTEVLSSRGWVRMVDLRDDDLLWDGEAFVPHEGLIYKGEQECIEFNGVTMTPDHKVFDGHKWEEAQSADESQCASYAERRLPAVV